MKNTEQVKVVVRCRPMNLKEYKAGYRNVVNVYVSNNAIKIRDPKEVTENKLFTFDAVYDFASTQEQLYHESVEPIVDSVLEGYNATIFAYGQTGTGKTYTMEGKQFGRNELGVIPRSFKQVFDHLSQLTDANCSVSCSYLEIYQEKIKDLLDNSGSRSYEFRTDQNSFYIKDLKWYKCNNAVEMNRRMKSGNANRKTGATDMNEHSSRSHAIFIINVKISTTICDVTHVKTSKLNLVDLAGSERQTKSRSSGLRLKEATKINLSLSALGNVISALTKERHFIPYRDSKLTRFLQDSLGGNSKTLMIANIGPACYNYVETLNTLKYASRAKHIKNKPTVNEDLTKDELIKKCRLEVERLKLLVQAQLLKQLPDQSDSTNRKRNRGGLLINDKIAELRNIIDNKETHLYITCKRIEYLEGWKENVENQIGMDVLTYTERQQSLLESANSEIQRINSNKQYLTSRLVETNKAIEYLNNSNTDQASSIVGKIESSHKIYNRLLAVKSRTSQIREQLEKQRSKLEVNHNRLLEQHGINQIIIDYFIPQTARALYASIVDEDLSDNMFMFDHFAPSNSSKQTNYSAPNMREELYELNSSSSLLCSQPSESKFKDNIIIYRDNFGVNRCTTDDTKQYERTEILEGVDQKENTHNAKRMFGTSMQILKKLLAIG